MLSFYCKSEKSNGYHGYMATQKSSSYTELRPKTRNKSFDMKFMKVRLKLRLYCSFKICIWFCQYKIILKLNQLIEIQYSMFIQS